MTFTLQLFASHLAKEVFGTIQIEQKVVLNNMNTADWFNKTRIVHSKKNIYRECVLKIINLEAKVANKVYTFAVL